MCDMHSYVNEYGSHKSTLFCYLLDEFNFSYRLKGDVINMWTDVTLCGSVRVYLVAVYRRQRIHESRDMTE